MKGLPLNDSANTAARRRPILRGMASLPLLAVLSALPALAAAPADDAWASRALSEAGTAVLEARFGPGRARLVARASAQRLETSTEHSRWTPVVRAGAARKLFVAGRPPKGVPASADAELQYYHRESETTRRDDGWRVTALKATAIVPEDAPEESVREAVSAASAAIGLDPARGDELALVRARPVPPPPGPPAWPAALASAAALLSAWTLASALPRAARVLAGAASPAPRVQAPRARSERRVVPLPELGRAREGGLDGFGGAA
jgi:hypothetical protein